MCWGSGIGVHFPPALFIAIMTDSEVSWYRNRSFLHFDSPISLENAQAIVTPESVRSHAFLPFIYFEKKISRKQREEAKVNPQDKRKVRLIMYASHWDSHIYSFYAYKIQKLYEERVEYYCSESIIAYRRLGKTNIHFAKDVFEYIKERRVGVAIAKDVKKFFGNLRHDILKWQWQSLLNLPSLPDDHYRVFKSLTRFSFIRKDEIFPHREPSDYRRILSIQEMRSLIRSGDIVPEFNGERSANGGIKWKTFGLPPGAPICALLSNIYMLDFDMLLTRKANEKNALYRRYCDDILLVCAENDCKFFKSLIRQSLNRLGLCDNPQKEIISRFSQENGVIVVSPPLQYLGFEYDGTKVTLRSKTIAQHKIKAIRCIRQELKFAKQQGLSRIRRKRIFSWFSHLRNMIPMDKDNQCGQRNFQTYVNHAAKIFGSEAIHRQMRKHWAWLCKQINKADDELTQN